LFRSVGEEAAGVGKSRRNQKRLHIGHATVFVVLAFATAIGKPLINPAVSWIVMALLAMAWLATGAIFFRGEPPR
jgi:hypothetical protein